MTKRTKTGLVIFLPCPCKFSSMKSDAWTIGKNFIYPFPARFCPFIVK
ncbi:hypothetical protein BCO26_0011 [Heyndrickxia coagulans 2-6]|nr:hypothetical protein BCO26_0011 [Heyndrickxia coagulans 2-6]